ncbi:tautomerase family protein [Herpetosiphon llansteffanensis]|uniref:tautomerase family protein n=1 Tax=Herpetosiphon llansteffanensis TaxID=2094568 RepID=UPI000D7C2811|nr:tautomerase family protein [Herpetosiphon llansteffanensis]
MAQIKVYGLASSLNPIKAALAETIHGCLVEHFQLPANKRFQRFFPMAADDWLMPADRSSNYLIIEISCFAGRSIAAKKALIQGLFAQIAQLYGIQAQDVEITLSETPAHNWGIRGVTGDELQLPYPVEI